MIDNPQALEHLNRAYYYYEDEEDFEAALAECEAALEWEPTLAEAHNLRGILLEELMRPADALRAYQQALDLDPFLVEAEANLADLRADLNREPRLVPLEMTVLSSAVYELQARFDEEGLTLHAVPMQTRLDEGDSVMLAVDKDEVDRALELLEMLESEFEEPFEWDEIELPDDWHEEETCLACGSDYIRQARHGIPVGLFGQTWFIIELPFRRAAWECQDCGYEWDF